MRESPPACVMSVEVSSGPVVLFGRDWPEIAGTRYIVYDIRRRCEGGRTNTRILEARIRLTLEYEALNRRAADRAESGALSGISAIFGNSAKSLAP